MNNNFGLDEYTIRIITDYFKQNPYIEKVKIYGSRAKNTYKQGSDIDFAIWLSNGGKIATVNWDLNELYLPYKFDTSDYNTTSQNLKKSIDEEGIIFYERQQNNV